MKSVAEAAVQLEARGQLTRVRRNRPEKVIPHVRALLGRELPSDLVDFYQEGIERIDDFFSAIPEWNDHVGWRSPDSLVTELLPVNAVPLFGDGFGNLYGLDLAEGARSPAVYFFDHEREFAEPEYAAGSSLGAFMLILADHRRAYLERWPEKWQLTIDPHIDTCPRARAIWAAG